MSMKRLVEQIGRIEALLCASLLGSIVLSIGLQISSRIVRGKALSWPEELSVILLIYSSFFGAGTLYKRQAHLAVDYFVRRFVPCEKQRFIARLAWFLGFIAFGVLIIGAVKGLGYGMRYTSGAVIAIPRAYLRFPLIFMCATNLFASFVFFISPPSEKSPGIAGDVS